MSEVDSTTGKWQGTDAANLNGAAGSLPPILNIFPPAFLEFEPVPFLRPFNLPSQN
jgi:hypothetical protein